jgi:amidase
MTFLVSKSPSGTSNNMPTHPSDADPAQLLVAGAAQCARAVASGRVTALALCEAAIDTIERRDGSINAVVVRDFDRAREQARQADERCRRGERAPLLGVPMTVKESFNVAGLPTTWGLPPFRDHRPSVDAVAVQRLKAAGAVILGKTNVPPGLSDWQSANPIYGRTHHPRDGRRSPGGSSGGGAAALAAGMVALEFGSDLLGSIRIPADFCGVWGHKSSSGVLPIRGQVFPGAPEPVGPAPDLPSVIGPLGRSADDLRIALLAVAGPESPMDRAWSLQLPEPRHTEPRQWNILLIDTHPLATLSAERRATLAEAAHRLEQQGARITRLDELIPGQVPDLAALHQTYMDYVHTVLGAFQPGATCSMNAHEWIRLTGRRAALRSQCFALLEQFDALVCPPFGVAAFEHIDEPDWGRRTLDIDGQATPFHVQAAWSSLASLAGLPATQVPVREDAMGMPMGVQVIGGWLQDLTTIEVARCIGG